MSASITPQEMRDQRRADKPIDMIDIHMPVDFREIHVEFVRMSSPAAYPSFLATIIP